MTDFNQADWVVVPVKLTAEMKAAWERSPWGERDCGCDADWAAFLSAAPAPPIVLTDTPADPWQPIETAPKDGTEVMLWLRSPFDRVEKARWYEPWHNWTTGDLPHDPEIGDVYGIGCAVPTHWMPLPKPPSAGGADD